MTDVDDKIINRAVKESSSITEIAQRFERDFLKDMEDLKVFYLKKHLFSCQNLKWFRYFRFDHQLPLPELANVTTHKNY
jgi:cysteinyl-tRNA synthetase